MGRAYGVDVARQVQVKVFHRHYLGIAAAGRPALDAKGRPLGRLADAGYDLFADVMQALADTDGGDRLALTQGGGRDGRHVNVLAVGAVGEFCQQVQVDFGFVLAIVIHIVFCQAEHSCDFFDRLCGVRLDDVNIARHVSRFTNRHLGLLAFIDSSVGGMRKQSGSVPNRRVSLHPVS